MADSLAAEDCTFDTRGDRAQDVGIVGHSSEKEEWAGNAFRNQPGGLLSFAPVSLRLIGERKEGLSCKTFIRLFTHSFIQLIYTEGLHSWNYIKHWGI